MHSHTYTTMYVCARVHTHTLQWQEPLHILFAHVSLPEPEQSTSPACSQNLGRPENLGRAEGSHDPDRERGKVDSEADGEDRATQQRSQSQYPAATSLPQFCVWSDGGATSFRCPVTLEVSSRVTLARSGFGRLQPSSSRCREIGKGSRGLGKLHSIAFPF